MKDTQTGWSLRMLTEVFYLCDQGLSVFYVLPTEDKRNDVVHNRIDVAIKEVPYYQYLVDNAIGTSDAVGLKHIGPGRVKFVASNSPTMFGEFPADIVVIDEYEKCNRENLPFAFDRTDASDYAYTRILGNPRFKNHGVDKIWQTTDKRVWMVQCPHCNEWQELDWFKHVMREIADNHFELIDSEWNSEGPDDIRVFCCKCNEPVDRLAAGEWIAEHPSRSVHGYHFSKLPFRKWTINRLWSLWVDARGDESKLQNFWNSKLGLPYSSAGTGLSRALLDRCVQDYTMPTSSDGPCTMGVDVGSLLHVRISEVKSGTRRAVYIGTVRDFIELDELATRYNVRTIVVDAMPETRSARQLADRLPGIVFLCQYTKTDKIGSRYGDNADFWMELEHVKRTVNVDRTQSLDSSHAAILNGENILPANAGTIQDYYDQMIVPTRVFDEARERFIWTKGEDHYRHADNYDHIAFKIHTGARNLMA